MSKTTLTDLATLQEVIDDINTNYQRIETAMENTLSRDGAIPNEMGDNLDMNGFQILNCPSLSGLESTQIQAQFTAVWAKLTQLENRINGLEARIHALETGNVTPPVVVIPPEQPVVIPPITNPPITTPSTAYDTGLTSISVSGRHIVDQLGRKIQLRGANTGALGFVAVQGWAATSTTPYSIWGQQCGETEASGNRPDFTLMRDHWKINVVRLPLNQASWLGYQCTENYDKDTFVPQRASDYRDPDPNNNSRSETIWAVNRITSLGMVCILDLHWSSPYHATPLEQNSLPDDDSLLFWEDIANTFKNNPLVIFEVFNEPLPYYGPSGVDPWVFTRDGGTMTKYVTGISGTQPDYKANQSLSRPAGYNQSLKVWEEEIYVDSATVNPDGVLGTGVVDEYGNKPARWWAVKNWHTPGFAPIVTRIRSTGATNPIILCGQNWAGNLDGWYNAFNNVDTLSTPQLICGWHTYRASSVPADPADPNYGDPAKGGYPSPIINYSPGSLAAGQIGINAYHDAEDILDAGFPVLITEIGDRNVRGTQNSPIVSTVSAWADANYVGIVGWGMNTWANRAGDNVLIGTSVTDVTDGYGRTFWNWCRSARPAIPTFVAPQVAPVAAQTATASVLKTITLSARRGNGIFAFTKVSGPGSVNASTGVWTWTPGGGDVGTSTVVIRCTSDGLFVDTTFTVLVYSAALAFSTNPIVSGALKDLDGNNGVVGQSFSSKIMKITGGSTGSRQVFYTWPASASVMPPGIPYWDRILNTADETWYQLRTVNSVLTTAGAYFQSFYFKSDNVPPGGADEIIGPYTFTITVA